jgi:hypothetical protein
VVLLTAYELRGACSLDAEGDEARMSRVIADDLSTRPTSHARAPIAAASALLLALIAFVPLHAPTADTPVSIIVREVAPATDAAEDAVERLGGTVTRQLEIIGGFSARIGARAVDVLRKSPSLLSVSADRAVHLRGVDDYEPATSGGWVQSLRAINAPDAWRLGATGAGVDVALIDSGIAPVTGLADPAKILNGPDLSFESQWDETRYLDTFGHGTHMASLIGGRDPIFDTAPAPASRFAQINNGYAGVAPDARLLNMKVATANGAVDVSQVIAALDWVVQHRNRDGLNVRVINLSFGTDSTQSYEVDPLAFAVENAWRKGIVVVAAAGNGGAEDTTLNNPAYDPHVIAVSASDTTSGQHATYTTPEWQTRGDIATRRPDLTAPGRSLVGLRVPGSAADQEFPSARVGSSRFFKGSGSSQATAMVSGAAAVLLSQRPTLTPDQVKAILMGSATPLPSADPVAQGSGLVNLRRAIHAPTPPADLVAQQWPTATGLGTLEGARGTYHIESDGVVLEGEQDIFGQAWDPATWTEAARLGTSWSDGDWNGSSWTGRSWTGSSWTGRSWTGRSWTGSSWTGSSWTGSTWTGRSWTGSSWTGRSWTGSSWTGSSWTRSSWTGRSWSRSSWTGSWG